MFDETSEGHRYAVEGEGMTAPRYYLIGHRTVARVVDHSYRYLDLETGSWVFDPTVSDRVHFEASTKELTESQARKWIERNIPGISVDLGAA